MLRAIKLKKCIYIAKQQCLLTTKNIYIVVCFNAQEFVNCFEATT